MLFCYLYLIKIKLIFINDNINFTIIHQKRICLRNRKPRSLPISPRELILFITETMRHAFANCFLKKITPTLSLPAKSGLRVGWRATKLFLYQNICAPTFWPNIILSSKKRKKRKRKGKKKEKRKTKGKKKEIIIIKLLFTYYLLLTIYL